MKGFEFLNQKPKNELEADVEEIELPDLPDFYLEIFSLINDFTIYKETSDIDLQIEQNSKINSNLKKIGDIEDLRKYFLFYMIVGSTPDIGRLVSFDTPQKDFSKLMKKIINNDL